MQQLDESQKHYGTWKKTDIRGYIIYDSTYKAFTERENYGQKSYYRIFSGQGRGQMTKGQEGTLQRNKSILYLDCGGTLKL